MMLKQIETPRKMGATESNLGTSMTGNQHTTTATVAAVARDAGHAFSKPLVSSIRLLTGLGVEGDAHCGATVKHRSRVAKDPTVPNRRQVHLIHAELLDEVARAGLKVEPGQMGENITTRALDVLGLPVATRLHIGAEAIVEITGLRNPCAQIDNFRKGLLAAVLSKNPDGSLIRKSGIMGIVIAGGLVIPGDPIRVVLPAGPHRRLEMV
jgi:MOSC domain-containing protein YiiM